MVISNVSNDDFALNRTPIDPPEPVYPGDPGEGIPTAYLNDQQLEAISRKLDLLIALQKGSKDED